MKNGDLTKTTEGVTASKILTVTDATKLLTPPAECPRCGHEEIVQGDDQVNYEPHVICNNNDCNLVMFEKDLKPKDAISKGFEALARALEEGNRLLREENKNGRRL